MPPESTPPADATCLHATSVAVGARAALITGASGAGKSALALQLIALGARLIADDRTLVWAEGDRVIAGCPPAITGRIEARGIGILAAPPAPPTPLALIVDLDRAEPERLPPRHVDHICGIAVPRVGKIDGGHFPAALHLYLVGQRTD